MILTRLSQWSVTIRPYHFIKQICLIEYIDVNLSTKSAVRKIEIRIVWDDETPGAIPGLPTISDKNFLVTPVTSVTVARELWELVESVQF